MVPAGGVEGGRVGWGRVWCGAKNYCNVFCWSDSQFYNAHSLKISSTSVETPVSKCTVRIIPRMRKQRVVHQEILYCTCASIALPAVFTCWPVNSSNCDKVQAVSSACICFLVHCQYAVSNAQYAASNDDLEKCERKWL
jgi:hypothetical protein